MREIPALMASEVRVALETKSKKGKKLTAQKKMQTAVLINVWRFKDAE